MEANLEDILYPKFKWIERDCWCDTICGGLTDTTSAQVKQIESNNWNSCCFFFLLKYYQTVIVLFQHEIYLQYLQESISTNVSTGMVSYFFLTITANVYSLLFHFLSPTITRRIFEFEKHTWYFLIVIHRARTHGSWSLATPASLRVFVRKLG